MYRILYMCFQYLIWRLSHVRMRMTSLNLCEMGVQIDSSRKRFWMVSD